ncbi:conserved hypothetical protein [Histoplasma capsulatum var. duboisii H88]|nr:conserved hypothetical protein [Histoplasma capsulatum var. duboisii H88]
MSAGMVSHVLVEPGVGSALHAASPVTSASAANAEDRCKLTFFHDSQHFGFANFAENASTTGRNLDSVLS